MAVLVALAWVGGGDTAWLMRIALSLQVVLVSSAAHWLARSAPLGGRWIGPVTAALLVQPGLRKTVINGQESALQYALLAATLAWSASDRRTPAARWAVGCGLLAGLGALARLDALCFGLALVVTPVIWPLDDGDRRSRVRASALGLGALALVVLPYFSWNLAVFGHLMPVSGALKLRSVIGPSLKGAVITLAVAAGLLAYWRVGRVSSRLEVSVRRQLRWLFPLVVYVGAQLVSGSALRGMLVPEIWYLTPHFLFAVLVVSAALDGDRRLDRVRQAGLAAVAIVLLTGSLIYYPSNPSGYHMHTGLRRLGAWLRTHTPEDALVTGWDVGIVAAESRRRVINLDGLINSWEYNESFLQRGRTDEFITRVHRVDYLAQFMWPADIRDGRYRGVDLRPWYVAYAECVRNRYLASPEPITMVLVVLSRHPTGAPVPEFARRLEEACRDVGHRPRPVS